MSHKEKIVDSWLVLETRKGDRKALATLVKRWHKKLCRQAYWYTKDMDAAKDIAQECWPTIIKNLKSLKQPESFGSWVLSIVTRKALDEVRRDKREIRKLETYYIDVVISTQDTDRMEYEQLITLLRSSIQELPTQHRIVLNLFYIEELTIRQISEIMKLPEGTIKSRLFNSREKLKSIIKSRNHEK